MKKKIIIVILIFAFAAVYLFLVRSADEPAREVGGNWKNPTSAPWTNGPSGPPPRN